MNKIKYSFIVLSITSSLYAIDIGQNVKDLANKKLNDVIKQQGGFGSSRPAGNGSNSLGNVGVGYSLVDENCNPQININNQMTQYLDKYKKILENMMQPSYWTPMLMNKTLDFMAAAYAQTKCVTTVSEDMADPSGGGGQNTAQALKCLLEQTKGNVETTMESSFGSGSTSGTINTSNQEFETTQNTKIDSSGIAGVAQCGPMETALLQSKKYSDCVAEEKKKFFNYLQGNISEALNFSMQDWMIQKEECMINRQNKKDTTKPILMDGFQIIPHGVGEDAEIIMRNTGIEQTDISAYVRQKVINKYGATYGDIVEKTKNQLLSQQPNHSNCLSTEEKNSSQCGDYVNDLLIYSTGFANWLFNTFNPYLQQTYTGSNGKAIIQESNNVRTEINVQTNHRWDFDTLMMKTKVEVPNVNVKYVNRMSIQEACENIMNGNSMQTDYQLVSENQPDSAKNEYPVQINYEIMPTPFVMALKYEDEPLQQKIYNSYDSVIKNNTAAITIHNKMKDACKTWAAQMLTEYNILKPKLIANELKANLAVVADGGKTEKIYNDLKSRQNELINTKIQLLKKIANGR